MAKEIITLYVKSEDHLANVLTKKLASCSFASLCFKLGMFDMYAPAEGGVLRVLPVMYICHVSCSSWDDL